MDQFFTDDSLEDGKTLPLVKSILHKIRRISQKIGIRVNRAMNPIDKERESDSAERDAAHVFRKMVNRESSDLLISPISNKKYVKNDEKRVLLILDEYQITLINHVFSYTIRLSQKTSRKLSEAFDLETENRRLKMEQAFKNNVKHSLQTIITTIND